MCVHVLLATRMPYEVLAWIDSQSCHTLVYADKSLWVGGQLTRAGRAQVDVALSCAGAEPLESARNCTSPPLWATAG